MATIMRNPPNDTDAMFARWAWELHAERCDECAHGLEYCQAGRRYLADTAPPPRRREAQR